MTVKFTRHYRGFVEELLPSTRALHCCVILGTYLILSSAQYRLLAQPSFLSHSDLSASGAKSSLQREGLARSMIAREIPRSRQLFERAVEHYNAGRYYSALDVFRRLKAYPPTENSQLTASYFMTMKSYYQIGKLGDAKQVGRDFLERFSESAYQDDVHECFGDVFVKEGRYRAAATSYLRVRLESDDEVTVSRAEQKLLRLADGFLSGEEMQDLLSTEVQPENRAILSAMLAGDLLAKGDPDGAALVLFRMDSNLLPPSFHGLYETLRERSYRGPTKAAAVGVVLPLSGFDEALGQAFLAGLQEAVKSISQQESLEIILEVMDNEGDNLRTVSCIQTLAANPNVIAIIGPLSTVNSVTAAAAIRSLDLPLLIPISTRVGLSGIGDNVFQMNTDLQKQGRFAAEYAVSTLGLKTVAVVAPADRFGKEMTDGFVQKADELGAKIAAVEWYSGIPVDLSSQFLSLRKIAFTLSAADAKYVSIGAELDTIDNTFIISEADFFPEEIDEKKSSKVDSSRIVLSSIEGLYLPIHPGDINYVASQFSSYSLDTQLLGNTNWYEPNILAQEMIGPNVNGIVMVTDYYHPLDQKNGDLSPIAKMIHGDRQSHRLALFGYDVITFLASRIGEETTRTSFVENLKAAKSFRGSGKPISFSDLAPRVNSSMYILQYRDGKILKAAEVVADSLVSHDGHTP